MSERKCKRRIKHRLSGHHRTRRETILPFSSLATEKFCNYTNINKYHRRLIIISLQCSVQGHLDTRNQRSQLAQQQNYSFPLQNPHPSRSQSKIDRADRAQRRTSFPLHHTTESHTGRSAAKPGGQGRLSSHQSPHFTQPVWLSGGYRS